MADNKMNYFKGFPMVRCGNQIYYGNMGDAFVTCLTICSTEPYMDIAKATNVKVQLIPTNGDMSKANKCEMPSLYDALNTANIWLTAALFG